MPELAQNRINFINQLHEAFVIKKGHGAFAYISISDALALFDQYLDSNESTSLFIDRFMRSF